MTHYFKTIWSPVGELTLVADDRGLAAILWQDDRPGRVRLGALVEKTDHPVLLETERQLGEYFAGERRSFDVPLSFAGTEFQKRVWAALLAIPFGETRSYGEIAAAIGRPGAVRAAGTACGGNRLAVLIPCHRVVRGDGGIGGYAWGVNKKQALLAKEKRK